MARQCREALDSRDSPGPYGKMVRNLQPQALPALTAAAAKPGSGCLPSPVSLLSGASLLSSPSLQTLSNHPPDGQLLCGIQLVSQVLVQRLHHTRLQQLSRVLSPPLDQQLQAARKGVEERRRRGRRPG